jgi:hypothetical protein
MVICEYPNCSNLTLLAYHEKKDRKFIDKIISKEFVLFNQG